MIQRKATIILTLLLLIVGIVGYSNEGTKEENVKKETEKQASIVTDKTKDDEEQISEEIEQISDEEFKELLEIYKKEDNRLTNEEIILMQTATAEQRYNLIDLTEEEVYDLIDKYHEIVNGLIIFVYQEGIDSDTYNNKHRNSVNHFEPELTWIRDKYDLGSNYHNALIKNAVTLMQKHRNGDNDSLFELKYIMYELNLYFNPDKAKEISPTSITLSDTEKIRKGEEPINDYEFIYVED